VTAGTVRFVIVLEKNVTKRLSLCHMLFPFDWMYLLWYDRFKHRIAAFTFSFLFRLMEET